MLGSIAKMVLLLTSLLLYRTQVEGATIFARGSFSRTLGTSTYTIPNNGWLPFTHAEASPVGSPYFTLQSDGRVMIHLAGLYLVMADCSFTAQAQMQFRLDDVPINYTTVGQEWDGILASTILLRVPNDEMVLTWSNPSGHSNVIPERLITTEGRAHLVILGVDDFFGHTHLFPSYLSVTQVANTFPVNPGPWTVQESKGNLGVSSSGQILIDTNRYYLVAYQFAPVESEYFISVLTSSLNTGYAVGARQLWGYSIVTSQRYELDFDFLPSRTFKSFEQHPHLGGAGIIYNNVLILELSNLDAYARFTTLSPPNGPHSISSWGRVPLDYCFGTCHTIVPNGGIHNSWRYTSDGVYLVNLVFTTPNATVVQYRKDSSPLYMTDIQKSDLTGQVYGSYLIWGDQTTVHNSIIVAMNTFVDKSDYGSISHYVPINVNVIRVA